MNSYINMKGCFANNNNRNLIQQQQQHKLYLHDHNYVVTVLQEL